MEKYFLAANSAAGFVSYFDDIYKNDFTYNAYIIKGGPGTGKSSFMRKAAKKAEEKGLRVIYCPCSSDPNSLDSVIFPEIKKVILDGTPPHTLEPKLAGLSEQIINLGEFWNKDKLKENGESIISAYNENKLLHKRAAAFLLASGEIIRDSLKAQESFVLSERIKAYAKKSFKPKADNLGKKGREYIRFLGGITPKGIIYFEDTINDYYKNVYVIEDKSGLASHILFGEIRKIAIDKGLDIITLKNPLLPDSLTDGILIPELSLAFMREYGYLKGKEGLRKIHAERFYDAKKCCGFKQKLKLNQKFADELLGEAVNALKQAKASHDRLENYYISAMDFERLNQKTDFLLTEILGI